MPAAKTIDGEEKTSESGNIFSNWAASAVQQTNFALHKKRKKLCLCINKPNGFLSFFANVIQKNNKLPHVFLSQME